MRRCLPCRWIVALCLLAPAARLSVAEESATGTEEYPVYGHGVVQLEVPKAWQVRYVHVDAPTPPSLYVTPTAGESFELTVTIYWHDGLDRDVTSERSVRELVEKVGRQTLTLSTQKRLDVKRIDGLRQPGFLFTLTDRNAGDDEYHYVTQGAMAVGDLVLAFTLLTDQQPSAQWEACLKMLKAARLRTATRGIRAALLDYGTS